MSTYFRDRTLAVYDVLVVGGGPVGSRVASGLSGAGYRVLVLEKKEKPGKVCCTGIVSQECVRAFGISEGTIWQEANRARIFSPSGELLRLWHPEPQAAILDREAFDAEMARRAREKGAEYLVDCSARSVTVEDRRVKVEAVCRGQSQTFTARAVVIATGFASPLVHRIGLGKPPDFVLGAQAPVEGVVEETEVYLGGEVAPGFFGWLVPTAPGRGLAGLLTRHEPRLYLARFLAKLHSQGKLTAQGKPSFGGLPLRPIPRTFGERLVVVGDAAGQVKPTTGGGLYFGLLCADIASEVLGEALKKDDLSAKNLARYQRAWQKRLGKELRTGYLARRGYERLSDRQVERLFGLLTRYGLAQAILESPDLSFDWHGRVLRRLLYEGTVGLATGWLRSPFRR